jgi:hypothetical protein
MQFFICDVGLKTLHQSLLKGVNALNQSGKTGAGIIFEIGA